MLTPVPTRPFLGRDLHAPAHSFFFDFHLTRVKFEAQWPLSQSLPGTVIQQHGLLFPPNNGVALCSLSKIELYHQASVVERMELYMCGVTLYKS